jgi:hypothetical protein
MKLVALIFFLTIEFFCSAQTSMNEINFNQIGYKKIVAFITDQQEHNVSKITDIKPSCHSNDDLSSFEKQEKDYLIKENFSDVWANYLKASPTESWEGKHVSFGVLLSKQNNQILYRGDDFKSIDTGQVVFLNLRLLRGIYQLAMAFEVINIDPIKGIIEFSYIEGNKSEGIQRLKFIPTPEGYTRIIHTSFYKSHSRLRDKIFYPYFHLRATNEFHRNLKRRLKHLG